MKRASSLVRLVFALVLVSCTTSETHSAVALVDEAGSTGDALEPSDAPVTATIEATTDDGASPSESSEAGTSCRWCSAYGAATHLGPIPAKLPELSGLAASRAHPGILYAHNDSGDTARFFAINDKAQITGEMDLTGATAVDWEDIAVGPCPPGSCVYLGDIGDNGLTRTEYAMYRVVEPDVLATDGSASSVMYERFPFVYSDGKHNAETLLVHPSGRVFVVIKVKGVPAGVYEFPSPLTPGVQATLQLVSTVMPATPGELFTGGSFHPCGDRLLLRTYESLYELIDASDGGPLGVFQSPLAMVPVAPEVQGEAVTYSLDGDSYFTSSETVGAFAAQLTRVGCP